MAAKAHLDERLGVLFHCPGCGFAHRIDPRRWAFNGDLDCPTISPSIKVTWDEGPEHVAQCCHSFVEGGHIRFLDDCTHALAGQTVALPDWD